MAGPAGCPNTASRHEGLADVRHDAGHHDCSDQQWPCHDGLHVFENVGGRLNPLIGP
jgi:hypothetical protein